MVTKSMAGPSGDQQQQQQQQKKFKLKNPFKKNKYKELRGQQADSGIPSPTDNVPCISSIEVLDLHLVHEQTDGRVSAESLEAVGQTDGWTECPTRSSRKKKRVRFWRYSKDEALLDDAVHIEEVTIQEPGTKGKKKKSKKKRAKQVGLSAWKYCKAGWKYMKVGLVVYSGVGNSMNMNMAFRPAPYTPTDYTMYDKYDQYGNKRTHKPKTDYTKYDAYCKTNRY